jgi:hypothetical protein
MAGKVVSALSSVSNVAVSGVWPGSEFETIARYLSKFEAVMLWVDQDTARDLWQKRETPLDFDAGPWSSDDWWVRIQTELEKLAQQFGKRGQLIEDGPILDLAKQEIDWSGYFDSNGNVLKLKTAEEEPVPEDGEGIEVEAQNEDDSDIVSETEERDDG